MRDAHYVYLYRSTAGVPKYVGYGMSVERALAHTEHSHNQGLRSWLDQGRFDLSVARVGDLADGDPLPGGVVHRSSRWRRPASAAARSALAEAP